MADAVASLKVMISGSAAGLVGSTNTAANAVEKLGSKVESASLGSASAGGSMGFMKMAGAVGVATVAVDAMKAAVSAVGSAITFVAGTVGAAMERIGTAMDDAMKTGASIEKLMGLQYAAGQAGIKADAVTDAIGKMNSQLATAAMTGEGASESLNKIGLDAATLAGMSPDAAFMKIGDALTQVENAATRSKYAVDIFGKSGKDLLPMFSAGAEGMQAAIDKAGALGVSLSAVDAAQVDNAGDALGDVGRVFEGLGNTFAVKVAPFIEAAATTFVEWATSGTTLSDRLSTGIDWVISKAGTLSNYLGQFLSWTSYFSARYLDMQAIVLKGFAAMGDAVVWSFQKILDAINKAAEMSNKMLGTSFEKLTFTPGPNIYAEFAKMAEAMSEKLDKESKAWTEVTANGALGKFVDHTLNGVRASAEANANASVDAMKKLNGAFTEVDASAKKTGGWMDWLKDKAKDVGSAMADSMRKGAQDMMDQGQRVYEATRTNDEKHAAEIEKLNKLRAAGVIDAETYQRAMAQADEKFSTAAKASEPQSPSFINAGSQAAANMIAQFQNQGAKDQIPKQQLAEQKKTTSAMENMVAAIKERPWGLAGI